MKKNKKGFTLIELLAVIVILAIIALISTPIVLNIIKSAKKSAFKRSAENVIKSAKIYYTSSLLQEVLPENIIFNCLNNECISYKKDKNNDPIKLDIEGNVGSGIVVIKSDGNIFLSLTNNDYCIIKYVDKQTIELKNGDCSDIDLTNDATKPVIEKLNVTSTTNSIQIVVSAKDEESGIYGYQYSIDNGATYTEIQRNDVYIFNNLINDKNYEVKVKVYNGTYGKKIYTEEKGMSESEGFKVLELPTFIVTPEDWSAEKEIQIDYKEALIKEYSLDSGKTFIEYNEPFKVGKNITIIAKASDENNNSINTQKISKVDTEKPLDMILSINGDETYTKIKSVTVTLKDTGGSGLASGSVKYGWSTSTSIEPSSYITVNTSSTIETNTTIFTASGSGLTGSYYLWVVPVVYNDTAGNSNETIVKSTGMFNFDNTAPTLTLGTATSTKNSIRIPISVNSDSYSGIESTICVAGTSTSNYNIIGTISSNTCVISGLNSSTTYYYAVISTDKTTNSISKTGKIATESSCTNECSAGDSYDDCWSEECSWAFGTTSESCISHDCRKGSDGCYHWETSYICSGSTVSCDDDRYC